MSRIYSLVFIALFACGCAVSGVDLPKKDVFAKFTKSVELKDFEPLIKEAVSQKPIDIEELGIKDYNDKDSVAFYDTPQVKILALLKTYQKEHFKFNDTLEKLAKDESQKDFVKQYQIAQRNILVDMLFEYYGTNANLDRLISYDEFVNIADSFFAEQGQFITDFGEYFFMALDKLDDINVCTGYYCGNNDEVDYLRDGMANLKKQNKLTDRLKNIYEYGIRGYNDFVKMEYGTRGFYLWDEKLNGKNLFATKPSKKQRDDFVGAFYVGDNKSKKLQKFMDFWADISLQRLHTARYGIEIALGSENVKSIIEYNPQICIFDIYLDSNAKKICENLALTQEIVEEFMTKITEPNGKFLTFFDDKMCVIVDFGVLDSEKYVDDSKKPKIITNPNNKSVACDSIKKALQKIK